jgi:hypothetical protein
MPRLRTPPIETLWLALPVSVLLALVGSSPIPPYDLWWPIVQGRATFQLGAIPQQNLFLYSIPADAPFLNQPWLAQCLMFALYTAGGPALLAYTSLALFASTLLISIRSALHALPHARLVAPLIFLLFAPDCSRWMPRTQMFATPLFALFTYLLLRYLDDKLPRRTLLLALLPLMILWANLHGSFFLTLLLVAACAAGQALHAFASGQLRPQAPSLIARWAPPAALCALLPLINPAGYKAYTYILDLTLRSHVSTITSEWLPLTINSPADLILLAWVTLPVALTLLLWRTAGWPRVFIVWGFAIMTFRSARSGLWWPLVLAPILPPLVFKLYTDLRTRCGLPAPTIPTPTPGDPRVTLVAAAALCLPVLIYLPGLPLLPDETIRESEAAEVYHPDNRYLHYYHPLTIGPKLAQLGYPGRIYHDASIGGYLEFLLTSDAPRQVAFVDQRIELVPLEIWRLQRDLSAARADWRTHFDRLGVQTALVNVRRQRPLQEALEADPAWTRVAVDRVFVLYMRADLLPDAWRDDPTRDLPIPPASELDENPVNAADPPPADTPPAPPHTPPPRR